MKDRLLNILLLILVEVRLVFKGSAKADGKILSRMLIVQTAKMGDMVCTTPMFRALKKAHPHSELIVAGDAVNERLLESHPDIDRYLIYEKVNPLSFARKLKSLSVDAAVVTELDIKALAPVYLSGIPQISAAQMEPSYSFLESRPYRLVKRVATLSFYRMGHYFPLQYLSLLKPFGIEELDTTKHLAYSEEARRRVIDIFKKEPLSGKVLVGITPSAGNRIKEWPVGRFAKVARHLSQKNRAYVVILGGPGDTNLTGMLSKELAEHGVGHINLGGTLSLDELKAVISKLSLLIGVDTGPIYIAEAFGVATVDIAGPVDEREQSPKGPSHKVISIQEGKPAIHLMTAREYDAKVVRAQIEGITSDMVIAAANELLTNPDIVSP